MKKGGGGLVVLVVKLVQIQLVSCAGVDPQGEGFTGATCLTKDCQTRPDPPPIRLFVRSILVGFGFFVALLRRPLTAARFSWPMWSSVSLEVDWCASMLTWAYHGVAHGSR